jgi:SAM-dependent methyltransferase
MQLSVMSPAEPVCRDPDWNEVWKERQQLHESVRIPDDPSHDWNRKENAERYAENARSGYDDRIRITLDGLVVGRTSRVLDIGAGPGTLSVPLAPRVKEITAVEPGEGMAAILEARAAAEGVTNISCIRKKWEEIDVAGDLAPPYDLVIASLSLTMEDIRAALQKMDAVCGGYVCLCWFVDMPFWERMYADLWEPLHGTRYHSGPKADCLFNVLYQMGIYANVEMFPLKKEYRFASRGEMIAFFTRRFDARSPAQQEIVEQYLTPLIREDGPAYVISGNSVFAKIWWKKD